jgi:hypothetical protein
MAEALSSPPRLPLELRFNAESRQNQVPRATSAAVPPQNEKRTQRGAIRVSRKRALVAELTRVVWEKLELDLVEAKEASA